MSPRKWVTLLVRLAICASIESYFSLSVAFSAAVDAVSVSSANWANGALTCLYAVPRSVVDLRSRSLPQRPLVDQSR